MTCEDEVSYQLYSFFSKSEVQVVSWHAPNGKQYFTRHLRIPRFSGLVRRGRSIIDLIMLDKNRLLLTECKCRLSESSSDVVRLRQIRDKMEFEELKSYFINQGAHIQQADSLLLGIGVRHVDTDIPPDFIIFEVKSECQLTVLCGSDIEETYAQSLVKECQRVSRI